MNYILGKDYKMDMYNYLDSIVLNKPFSLNTDTQTRFSLIFAHLTVINDLNLLDGPKGYENVLELLFVGVHTQTKNTYHLARGRLVLK